MYPPLEDAEPVAAYAGLRPAGRGVNYLIGPSARLPGPRQRGGDPLHRPDRLARDRRARVRDRRASSAWRSAPSGRSSPAPAHGVAGPWWRRTAEYRAAAMSRLSLLLGIDEGTSAVKAVLFDADLRPVRGGAAREGARASPPGLGRAGPRGGPGRRRRRGRRAARPTPPGRSWPAGSTTRASRCWPGTPRAAGPLTPIVTWQDKRSQEVLDRLEADGRADEVRERSGMPLDPYFSAGKLAWLLEHDAGGRAARATRARCGSARSTRSSATGSAPASRPTPRPRRAPSSGAPEWDPALLEIFGVPRERAARDRGHGRRPRHAAPSLLAGRAAAAGALRRPAGGARRRRLRRARPGQGHLRHRRVRARARGRRAARARAAACCPPSPGGWTGASSGRSTAACSPPARCSSG